LTSFDFKPGLDNPPRDDKMCRHPTKGVEMAIPKKPEFITVPLILMKHNYEALVRADEEGIPIWVTGISLRESETGVRLHVTGSSKPENEARGYKGKRVTE
jgi:hypothetical protein